MIGMRIRFIRLDSRDIENPAKTRRRGLNGLIKRTSLCVIAEKETRTPTMTKVYMEKGNWMSACREKGRYVVKRIGRPWER